MQNSQGDKIKSDTDPRQQENENEEVKEPLGTVIMANSAQTVLNRLSQLSISESGSKQNCSKMASKKRPR